MTERKKRRSVRLTREELLVLSEYHFNRAKTILDGADFLSYNRETVVPEIRSELALAGKYREAAKNS